ncbi:MAG: peptidoglycan editing factor PgeF [Desulfobacterales bacterium]
MTRGAHPNTFLPPSGSRHFIGEHTGGLLRYRFANLIRQDGLEHGIFSRLGGGSRPPYDSLNLAYRVGDRPEAVAENRRRLQLAMGKGRLVFLRQVHGARVVTATDRFAGDPGDARGDLPAEEGDALITDIPGLWLSILVADCQAVLLWDPVRRAAANIHAGWRGSIANIVGAAVEAMGQRFGTNPRHLLAAIGPSLGTCCAEFVNYRTEIPTDLWSYMGRDCRYDFWRMTRDQLAALGVERDNILTSGVCTRCSTDLFFSYRGEATTGRFAAVIGITDTDSG